MNNPTAKKLISTNSFQYFGKGADNNDRAMSTAFLESNFKISIHQVLPPSEQTQTSKFNYKMGPVVYLSPKKCRMLLKLIKKWKDDPDTPLAVNSSKSLIEISNGAKFGTSGFTLTIYNDINADRTCDNFDSFIFSENDEYISNYDNEHGSYDRCYMQSDIEIFMDQLKEFATVSSCAVAHTVHKELGFSFNGLAAKQLQIMEKLGIRSSTYSGGSNNYYSSNPFKSNNDETSSSQMMSTDDIMKELDNM